MPVTAILHNPPPAQAAVLQRAAQQRAQSSQVAQLVDLSQQQSSVRATRGFFTRLWNSLTGGSAPKPVAEAPPTHAKTGVPPVVAELQRDVERVTAQVTHLTGAPIESFKMPVEITKTTIQDMKNWIANTEKSIADHRTELMKQNQTVTQARTTPQAAPIVTTWDAVLAKKGPVADQVTALKQFGQSVTDYKAEFAKQKLLVDQLKSDQVTQKWEAVITQPGGIPEHITALKEFGRWVTLVKEFVQAKTEAKKTVEASQQTFSRVSNTYQKEELDFQKTFFDFKKTMTEKLTYIENNVMTTPTATLDGIVSDTSAKAQLAGTVASAASSALSVAAQRGILSNVSGVQSKLQMVSQAAQKVVGRALDAKVLEQTVKTLKDLYMEKEFGLMYKHYRGRAYIDTPTGPRQAAAIDREIDAAVHVFAAKHNVTTPAKEAELKTFFQQRYGAAVEGLAKAGQRQGDYFTILSFTKDAYAAVPRFYTVALNATETTQKKYEQYDITKMDFKDLQAKTREIKKLNTAAAAMATKMEAHLVGDQKQKILTEDSIRNNIESVIQSKTTATLEFSGDFKNQLSAYLKQRMVEQKLIDRNGVAMPATSRPDFSPKSGEPSQARFQAHFAPGKKYATQYEAIKSSVAQLLTYRHEKAVGPGGQLGEMKGVTQTFKDNWNQLDRMKWTVQLKTRAFWNLSFAEKAEQTQQYAQIVKENLQAAGVKYSDQEVKGYLDSIRQAESQLAAAKSTIQDFQAKLTAFANGGPIGDVLAMESTMASLGQMAQTAGQTLAVLGDLVSENMPMLNYIKGGVSILYHLKTAYDSHSDLKATHEALLSSRSVANYVTTGEGNPVEMKNQVKMFVKMMHSKDAKEKSLASVAVNALNLASGFSVGTLLEKAYNAMFTTPLNDDEKEKAYEKIAQDAMTILSSYRNLATGSAPDAITRAFAPSPDLYTFARNVQDASTHLPDEKAVQDALENFLTA